jgi:hypothetical protein
MLSGSRRRQSALFLVVAACVISFGCGGAVSADAPTSPALPALSLSASSLTFTDQVVNTTSGAQVLTVRNTGTATLSISGVRVTGDYAQTNNCGTSLAANASCTINVTFTPTATGTRTGTLTVTDNASGSPHSVALTGNGASATAPAVSLTPSSLTYASQVVNTTSTAQVVTLKNTGTASLTISGIAVTGDYKQTNNCGTSLAANASCTINVTFTPTATGTRTGTLTVTDNASGSPHKVTLSGTGITPGQLAASPTSLSFGNVTVGQSGTQTVTLSNSGGASLTISSASTSGPGFSISGLTLPMTLAAGKSLTFSVAFQPSNDGTATGSVTLSATGTVTTVVISLSGTAVAPVAHSVDLSWDASTSTVVGYNVYRGTQTGGPYVQINSTLQSDRVFTDSNVQAGQKYFYVVTSVDANNVESNFSNEAVATVPTP